jgi:hypothetical protein
MQARLGRTGDAMHTTAGRIRRWADAHFFFPEQFVMEGKATPGGAASCDGEFFGFIRIN